MHLTGSRRNSVREATSDRASAWMAGNSEANPSPFPVRVPNQQLLVGRTRIQRFSACATS